ncbi:hypothetical protein Q7P36_000812 [Cladosporium allicinum]
MFTTMKLAAIALLSLSSVASAYPGETPPAYGTTTSTKKTTTSKTTSSTCKPSTYTINTSGWSTYTTYKPVTTSVLTTYKSNYPVVTTETDKVKTTYTTTVKVPYSGPYTSVSTGYSTSNEVKDVTVTLGKKTITETKVITTTSTRLVDNVRVEKTTIPHTSPVTSTKVGVTSGVSTVTKPVTETKYVTVTKTNTNEQAVDFARRLCQQLLARRLRLVDAVVFARLTDQARNTYFATRSRLYELEMSKIEYKVFASEQLAIASSFSASAVASVRCLPNRTTDSGNEAKPGRPLQNCICIANFCGTWKLDLQNNIDNYIGAVSNFFDLFILTLLKEHHGPRSEIPSRTLLHKEKKTNPSVVPTMDFTSSPNESQSHEITALRAQIMANATLLFWHTRQNGAPTLVSEVGLMTGPSGDGYIAVLSIPKGIGRVWAVAAQGRSADSVVGALRSLLDVTAAALAKWQGSVLKGPSNPGEIAGGLIDEGLVKGRGEGWEGLGWVVGVMILSRTQDSGLALVKV